MGSRKPRRGGTRFVSVTPADSPIGNGPKDSCRHDGKSRVTGDCHARFRGSRRVRFPPATRLTTQQLLPLVPAGAVLIGDAAALVTDGDGGRVFIRGELCNAWDAGDDLGRRLAAVQLVRIKAARAMAVATAFGVTTVTLWRWRRELDTAGAQGLAQDKRGPKGPSRLTPDVVADIASRRRGGASLRAIAAAVGVSTFSVRRALPEPTPEPVFTPAARVPLAGLLLAIPALQATGLLSCATQVFGCLPNGFYGLDTMLLEGVLRALAGEPRVEGATRVDPAALGRVLGLDRGPEVKTIRAKITTLAGTGRAGELLAAMASAHVARLDASDPDLLAVFYVDGHVRAYQGGAKIAK